MSGGYGAIACAYDCLNGEVDYAAWADLAELCFESFLPRRPSLVLDLGCGTGILTDILSRRGYDMTGVDASPEMLAVARERCSADTLLLCQDMRSFELYGTVDAVVCTLDSINYLTSLKDVESCFSLVNNYLIPEGVFVFDINTPYRFENVYANNDIILENNSSLLAWQNSYNKKTKICKFYLSIFENTGGNSYSRFDEVQTEKCYSRKQIERLLEKCGFELLCVYGSLNGDEAKDDDEKWYFVARCKK